MIILKTFFLEFPTLIKVISPIDCGFWGVENRNCFKKGNISGFSIKINVNFTCSKEKVWINTSKHNTWVVTSKDNVGLGSTKVSMRSKKSQNFESILSSKDGLIKCVKSFDFSLFADFCHLYCMFRSKNAAFYAFSCL